MAKTHSTATTNGHLTVKNAKMGDETRTFSARQMTLGDIARLLEAELVGDAETLITSVASLDEAVPGALAFVEHDHRVTSAMDTAAAALIVPASSEAEARRVQSETGKPVLLSGNPRLAFARVVEFFQPAPQPEIGIHPSAI